MGFEWDEGKNIANYAKRKIWFEEAQTVWADEMSDEFYDLEHSHDEERFIRVGHSTNERVLLVVFCERQSGEVIRIISARKASKKERTDYER